MKSEILALHQALIDAHLNKDVDFFVRDLSEDYMSISHGEILKPTKEEIRVTYDSYLNNTEFTEYRDLCEPIIGFSQDGSIAWSIVQVKLAGKRTMDDGSERDMDSTWAWLTLYERQGDKWIRLLEVSNAKSGGTIMELESKLIELIERAFQEEQILVDKLSEDERSVVGEPDCWSVKDVIVHLAGWKTRLAKNLAAAASGGTPVQYEDFEAVNAQEFEENRDRPWPEVMEMASEAHRLLVEQVEARDEDELRGTETLPWQGDRPLWRYIAGTGYTHAMTMHLGPIYVERGEKEYATKMQEEAAKLAVELDVNKDWQGVVQYNLACHYASIGETAKAIESVGQALELSPALVEWSKQDPDLAPIREEPGYQALYSE